MALRRFIAALFSPFRRPNSTSSDPRHQLGRKGEALAARYLRRAGFKVIYRNYRPRRGKGRYGRGEVDLVCREGETLVFVEVKTRRSTAFGQPHEAVTLLQKRRIIAGALSWVRLLGNPPDLLIRFDIVEVHYEAAGPRVNLIRDAFSLPWK